MSDSVQVAIDIGTSNIELFVGRENEQEELEIIAHVSQPARGIKRGIVVDIESATNSIGRALQQVALMADIEIGSAYISISGNHLRAFNGQGSVVAEQGEITHQQITRLMDTVRASSKEQLAPDYVFTHILPQEYVLDKQEGIRHPLGMTGQILEMQAHIISFPRGAVENLRRCVEKNNVHVLGLVSTTLADGYAVLTDDEKELGVCLVNIGAGTTEVAVYFRGKLAYSICLPIAGDQVTSDIAYMFTAPTSEAEKIKVEAGSLMHQEGLSDRILKINATGNRARELSVGMLQDVIRQRYSELFHMVVRCVEESGYSQRLGAGVVMTGGAANVPGLVEFAEECMGVQVRVGLPYKAQSIVGDIAKPEYATGIGLLHHAMQETARSAYQKEAPKGWFAKLMHWFKGNF